MESEEVTVALWDGPRHYHFMPWSILIGGTISSLIVSALLFLNP